MSDNTTKFGPPDSQKISLNERYEVESWTHAFGVNEEELRKAVAAVGPLAKDVRAHLGK